MDEEKKTGLSKKYIVGIAIFLLLFLGAKLWQLRWPTAVVEVKGVLLEVQVAGTIFQAEKGLGGRDAIGKYDGMYFPFSFPRKHAIVMRDMRFPIDILWIHKGEIVDIAPNVPTEPGIAENELRRYRPRIDANAVLELPAGWVDSHAVKIGDYVRIIE